MECAELVTGESGQEALGARLAASLHGGMTISLSGELGAGKTTLVRGLLRALGYPGPVRSPTYTLVETYEIRELKLCHFDLYRLADPEELEFMGWRDYFADNTVVLIEWPEKAGEMMPTVDITIQIAFAEEGESRRVLLRSWTLSGEKVLVAMSGISKSIGGLA